MSETKRDHNVDYQRDIYKGEVSPVVQRHAKKREDYENNKNLPWHQRKDESGTAYAAFRIYLDIGISRTQKTVAKVIYGQDTASTQIKEWSIKYDWVNRAEDWDRVISEAHISNMEDAVRQAEEHGLRHLHAVTVIMTEVALGNMKASREQTKMIDSFMDRFGAPKQKPQAAINVNNYNVNTPALPGESTKGLLAVEDADFEVMQESADDLIPKKLKK